MKAYRFNKKTIIIAFDFAEHKVYHHDQTGRLPAECSEYFEKYPKDNDQSDTEKCIKSFSVAIKITEK